MQDGLIVVLVMLAIVATLYRIAKTLEEYENYKVKETEKLKPLISDWDGYKPYDAEEVRGHYEHTVYVKETYKYYKSSTTKTWNRVAEKCPGCRKYLPTVTENKKIVCPKCKLTIAKTRKERETYVWRE